MEEAIDTFLKENGITLYRFDRHDLFTYHLETIDAVPGNVLQGLMEIVLDGFEIRNVKMELPPNYV